MNDSTQIPLEKLANDARFLVLSPKGKPRGVYAHNGYRLVAVLTGSENNPTEYLENVPSYFHVIVNKGQLFGEPIPFGSDKYNQIAKWFGSYRAAKPIFRGVDIPVLVGPSLRRYEQLSTRAKPNAEQVAQLIL